MTVASDLSRAVLLAGRRVPLARRRFARFWRADAALRASEERNRILLASLPQSVLFKDRAGHFQSVNDVFAADVGLSREEILGRTDHDLYPADIADGYRAADLSVMRSRQPLTVEEVNVAGGERRIVEATKAPVIGDDGEVQGILCLFTDVTERHRAQEALQRAQAELQRSNRELQEFAAVASHDLHEPLRKVRAFGDRLARRAGDVLDDESRADLERIQDAAARMEALIDDLLEYARVTSRARPFAPVDLNSVAADVIDDLAARLEKTGGRVEVTELPTIDGDATQMRQLLQNLVGNGLKFHREGVAPVVRVSVEPGNDAAGVETMQLTVADNGIGFEPRHADRIFVPFERLHGRAAYEGTGIGLAICHKIVERHGGGITASGRPGEGASFSIVLPLTQAAPARQEPVA